MPDNKDLLDAVPQEQDIFTPMPEEKLRDLIDPEERRIGVNHPPFNSQESRPELFKPKDGPAPGKYDVKQD